MWLLVKYVCCMYTFAVWVTTVYYMPSDIQRMPYSIWECRSWAHRWLWHWSLRCQTFCYLPSHWAWQPLTGMNLYYLVTGAQGCEQLAQSHYVAASWPWVKPITFWWFVWCPPISSHALNATYDLGIRALCWSVDGVFQWLQYTCDVHDGRRCTVTAGSSDALGAVCQCSDVVVDSSAGRRYLHAAHGRRVKSETLLALFATNSRNLSLLSVIMSAAVYYYYYYYVRLMALFQDNLHKPAPER